jgi:hypothetical protein
MPGLERPDLMALFFVLGLVLGFILGALTVMAAVWSTT